MKNFIRNLLIFSSVIGVVIFVLTKQIPVKFISPHLWYLFTFFVVSTVIIHFGLHQANKKSPQLFARFFIAITSLKMFIYLCFIVVYALFNRENAVSFILSFLVFYILFTVFEVIALLKHKSN